MTFDKRRLKVQVLLDYRKVRGTVITVPYVAGYQGAVDSAEKYAPEDEPFRVIVTNTRKCDLLNVHYDWLDPYWNVKPAPGETRLDDMRSWWVDGPSYPLTPEAAADAEV